MRTCLALRNCSWASISFCFKEFGSGVCRLPEGERPDRPGEVIFRSGNIHSSSVWPDGESVDRVPGDFLRSSGVVDKLLSFVDVDFRDVFVTCDVISDRPKSCMRWCGGGGCWKPGRASTGAPKGTNILYLTSWMPEIERDKVFLAAENNKKLTRLLHIFHFNTKFNKPLCYKWVTCRYDHHSREITLQIFATHFIKAAPAKIA